MSLPFPPHLDESTSAAPQFSPGPVEDEEILLRDLFNPEHIENGRLTKRIIRTKDLISKGYSVHRMKHTSPDFIKDKIHNTITRPRSDGSFWKDEGVALLEVGAIRAIRDEEEHRVFRVIDTASENDKGHASIYVFSPEKGEAYARKVKKYLLPFLQHRISVDKAYQN